MRLRAVVENGKPLECVEVADPTPVGTEVRDMCPLRGRRGQSVRKAGLDRVVRHGGFSLHVVVHHPRYLFDFGDIDPAVATTYSCSGITVYSAVRKLQPLDPARPVLLVGAGDLGLAAIAMLKALGHDRIVVVDISADKRQAALDAGADAAVDGADGARLPRAVGQAGDGGRRRRRFQPVDGRHDRPSPLDHRFGTGSQQDLRDVLALARSGKLKPIPVTLIPKDEANAALMKLKSGETTGRLMLEGA